MINAKLSTLLQTTKCIFLLNKQSVELNIHDCTYELGSETGRTQGAESKPGSQIYKISLLRFY